MKLTAGQRKFFKAVAEGTGGLFHKRVIEPIEGLPYGRLGGLVRWTNGTRLVGCNSFSAHRFALTEEGKAAWQMPGDFSQTRSDGTVAVIPKGSLVPGWRPALPAKSV